MRNTKTKVITALLLSLLTLAVFPFAANASTGFILINTLTAPSPVGVNVQAGGNVSLYFGGVGFSGGQFYLYMSADGLSQISAGDQRYTVVFNLADLQAATPTQYTGVGTFPGQWTVGGGWVNGTIKQDVAGGNYFIKAFDGTSTAVAVTDTYITVIANVFIAPTQGSAGQQLTISGYAFPANSLVNITYSSVALGATNALASLLQTGAIGNFSYTFAAPDSKLSAAAGDQPIPSEVITFNVQQNKTGTPAPIYSVNYTEFGRGIAQLKVGTTQQVPTVGQLFGNNTVYTLGGIGVTKSLRIAGNYFYPGSLVTKWDNVVVNNTAPTINGTGWFNTTLTVPPATNGQHNITLTDGGSNVVFVMYVTVVPSLNLNPTSGPSGTTVTVTGYGWGATSGTTKVNATVSWLTPPLNLTSAFTDAAGTFTATFVVPNGPGGVNTVVGASNETGTFVTIASATFTITASFTVSPSSFDNNFSLLVTATGTGFKPGSLYFPNIDNQMIGVSPLAVAPNWQTGIQPDVNGTIKLTFVGAGFSSGTHVVSLYENGTLSPSAYAGFYVTGDSADPTLGLIKSLNTTIAGNNAVLVAIQGDIATIKTSVGTSLTTQVSGLGSTLSSIQSSIANIQIPNIGSITTSLNNIAAQITSLQGDTATIKTDVGTVTTSLDSIGATVTSLHGDTATIKTDLGTLTGKVDSISGNVATITTQLGTIQTSLGAVQSDVQSAKSSTETLSPLIIVAIVLALIAAIAAIASIVLMRRKIAG